MGYLVRCCSLVTNLVETVVLVRGSGSRFSLYRFEASNNLRVVLRPSERWIFYYCTERVFQVERRKRPQGRSAANLTMVPI